MMARAQAYRMLHFFLCTRAGRGSSDLRYNGHPEFAYMTENFRAALDSSDTVAVVGVGNVALDCARILAKGKRGLPRRCYTSTDAHE